jgi:hypothetical protein
MTMDRLSVVALCVTAGLSLGVLVIGSWVRQNDLERLAEQNEAQIVELEILHDAICDMRSGYGERQELFSMFLSRPFPGGPTQQLVVALRGSFAETLFALRHIDCVNNPEEANP